MTIEEIKIALTNLDSISFELPNGDFVPGHFHVTEVGKINKDFIDCGGTRRSETLASFQLWEAGDVDHRLQPSKLINIIELSQKVLGIGNEEIEVEYQADTIGKYGLDFNGNHFTLVAKQTNCLAKDNCGVPENVAKSKMIEIASGSCCTPDSGCC